ncbi:hypothetical protein QBZ16_000290 [Prototheca wickerhamii]|uniref:THUMP domain-containing protein n=1 Tax=Prototheca wickerhamii TaxID=3111 RepID=A0AAD9IPA5_PROWI|nr:hypothetical protein QBZ16_000290 [Prototheca wickerhamii]
MAAADSGRKRTGDGGASRASKRKYFANTSSRKDGIPLGSRGILISCAGGKENIAAREAIDVFTQIYEQIHPEAADAPAAASSAGQDVASLLAAETADLRNPEKKLFFYHSTGIHSTTYVEIKYAGAPGPAELVTLACKRAQTVGRAGTKLCNRFYPIESTCYASLEKIREAGVALAAEHFPESGATQFAVQYEHRASPGLDRMEVINAVVDSIKTPPHKVNLSNPEKTILVNVLKTTCGFAVVHDFKALQKYNVQLLAAPAEAEEAPVEAGAEADKDVEQTKEGDEEKAEEAEAEEVPKDA